MPKYVGVHLLTRNFPHAKRPQTMVDQITGTFIRPFAKSPLDFVGRET